MKIVGKFWKHPGDKLWLIEIPSLDFMTQARTKKEIPEMVKDALELLIEDTRFHVTVNLVDSFVLLDISK
jgi:predicted RNase H-like HicB family nuclease